MTLPRIRVDVTGSVDVDAGWTVTVGNDVPLVDPYTMVPLILPTGIAVPTVPADRRPPPTADHYALCAGDVATIADLLRRLDDNSTEAHDVKNYGRWLYECLLAPAWSTIREVPEVVAAKGLELALRWDVSAGPLHDLLWEAMHDADAPLAGHPGLLVAITRVVPCTVAAPTVIARAPRVLLAAGSALTDEVIRPGAMFMGLIRSFEAGGLCAPRVASEVTVSELGELCASFQPDFIQLVAHGEITDVALPDGSSRSRGVIQMAVKKQGGGIRGADSLLPALTSGGPVTALVLCACRSGSGFAPTGALPLALELVAGGIPVVVAMTGDVSEQACRLYTRQMIASVHAGAPLVEAAAKGRRAALIGSPAPGDHIDWAMPALFVAEAVDTGQRLVDPEPSRRISGIAADIELFEQPVFIGRTRELDVLDDMPPEPHAPPGQWRVGCVVIRTKGPLRKQGGTRLLREMGYRLLHAGHVPLLLGTYNDGQEPDSLRSAITELLGRMAHVAEVMALAPPQSTLLESAGLLPPADAATLSIDERLADLNERIAAFKLRNDPLDPGAVRPRLGTDLRALARAAGTSGAPFGPHTTPVVLIDEIHRWTGSAAEVFGLIRPSGLGTPDEVIPVVVTGSERDGDGSRFREFAERNSPRPSFRIFDLERMSAEEASLGFQWILMNPWGIHQDVYTAMRYGKPEHVSGALETLDGLPTAVTGKLYEVARILAVTERMLKAHDEDAYRLHAEHYR